MIVGLLHPGNMGSAIGARLVAAGNTVLWIPQDRSDATHRRALTAALTPAHDVADLLRRCEVVLSIVPAAAAEPTAAVVAEHGYQGLYIDANAISPQRMNAVSESITHTGGTVVDAVISGPPPHGERPSPRIFLAGSPEATHRADSLLRNSALDTVIVGPSIGAASALKMALTSYQRTSRVLAALAQALADEHGVGEGLDEEARRLNLDTLADRDSISGVAARAWRWEPEMREIAATLEAAHLPSSLALTTAELYARLAEEKDNWSIAPATVLAILKSPTTIRP